MIWALIAWHFFGGAGIGSGAILSASGVEALREQVIIVVEDDARRQGASDVLRDLQKSVKAFEKAFRKSGKQLDKLYADHADTTDEALGILDSLNIEWAAGQQKTLDARFELRDKLTEQEWSTLFDDSAISAPAN